MPNLFHASNFDPSSVAPNRVVIFDDTGYIDDGGLSNPIGLGYTQPYTDGWLQGMFAANGLGDIVYDIDAQFPDATYHLAINSAITTSQGTTYYVDHGFQGTNGSEVISDFSGDNVANTGGGADLILLGSGNNFVSAGNGDDVVVTGTLTDVIKLGNGNDWVWAGAGDDTVRGGKGDDVMLGREGADTLAGGKGEDRIDGGADDDKLIGGDDADIFVFEVGTGRDLVRDFEAGVDTIEIEIATGVTGFGDVLGAAQQFGNRVEIDLGNGDEIVLRGVQLNDLSASDFDFV